jgi:putative RecB family exonuclease
MKTEMKTKLSPSRMKDYEQCPKLYYFKNLGISTPPTLAIAKGVISHIVFDILFDHVKSERDKSLAVKYVTPAINITIDPYAKKNKDYSQEEINLRDKNNLWEECMSDDMNMERKIQDAEQYKKIITMENIEEFTKECEKAVLGWFAMENPMKFDPMEREFYISGQVGKVEVHGVIDRIDKIVNRNNEIEYYISDYKTGNPPSSRFIDNAFFQLEVYGLLVRDVIGVDIKELRLIYVKENKKDAVLRKPFTKKDYESTKKKIININKKIEESNEKNNWPTKKQTLCGWCFFQNACPAFNNEAGLYTVDDIIKVTGGVLRR